MKQVPVRIPVTGRRDAIEKYLLILYHFHKLTDKEIKLLTELIHYYVEYNTKYGSRMANKLLFDKDTSVIIRKNLDNMADTVYRNYLSNLRKKGVIKGRELSSNYIPPMSAFSLVFTFYAANNKGNST